MAKTPTAYDIDLDRNPANYQPLTPLGVLERAASVFPAHTAIIHGKLRRTYAEFYARVFNSRPYDELHGYSNVNLAVILTNQDGWQVMGYVKNLMDTTAITGAFLNTDDTGLTTNIFVTDPRLFGIRITKNW